MPLRAVIKGLTARHTYGSAVNRATDQTSIVWRNVIIFSFLHVAAVYGVFLIFTSAKLLTLAYTFFLFASSGMGITAGVHRLWAHRAYKATWQLRLILMIFNTIALQNSAIEWARDHRVHHKFSETNADPHNAKRGFFFAHIGWLLCKKHPDVTNKGKGVDMSDLQQDPILRFQQKYYLLLAPLVGMILPTTIPVYLWSESWANSFFVSAMFRYVYTLHTTWLVNSAAHLYGSNPYDKSINPAENKLVAFFSGGEGWHNYHHVFPWDYKTAELGQRFNVAAGFIEFCERMGWAYDLRSVPESIVKQRVEKSGDGSHKVWGDVDQDQFAKTAVGQ